MTTTETSDPDVYTVDEFAARMRISRQAAYRLLKPRPGGGPAPVPSIRLGRTLRIPRDWVDGLFDGRVTLGDGESV